MLKEFQRDDDKKIKELVDKVYAKLRNTRSIIKLQSVKDFVNENYDLLITDIDTIEPTVLLDNYIDFLNKLRVFESVKQIVSDAENFLKEINFKKE